MQTGGTVDKRSMVDWRGYIPAITTPFDASGAIDFVAFARLLEWLHGEGMHGLLVAGTTGEWTSMSAAERCALFAAAGDQLAGKLPLLAGCSGFTAREVLQFADAAAAARFDGIVVTPPPYIRPNEQELLAFYAEIDRATPLPVCIYNWPPGTGIDMPLGLLERLTDLPRIVAVKQSTSRLEQFVATFFALREKVRIFGHAMDEHGLALLEARGGDGTMGAGAVRPCPARFLQSSLGRADRSGARLRAAGSRADGRMVHAGAGRQVRFRPGDPQGGARRTGAAGGACPRAAARCRRARPPADPRDLGQPREDPWLRSMP